jgi:DNA adenine methylase
MARSQNGRETSGRVVNVASVPHRSPFRYPGGKTWLVPRIRQWLTHLTSRPSVLGEPFAGGAIVGLSALFEGLVDSLTLVERDEHVSSVWRVILNGKANQLIERITSFEIKESAIRQLLSTEPTTLFDRAFATIVRNRVQRGGIMAPGASLMKEGENGRGVASRWYVQTLCKRIEAIAERKSRINFIQGDGIQFIRDNAQRPDMVFFIDPPYTVAGRRLYLYSEIDHEELFRVTAKVKGDFLMTYDNAGPVRQLAGRFGFDACEVAMKSTHHAVMSELLIGRDLAWVRAEPRQTCDYPLFKDLPGDGLTSDQS